MSVFAIPGIIVKYGKPDPVTPATPGKDMEFIKPNVPDCWEIQPVYQVVTTASGS